MKKLKYIALGLSALLLASCAMEEMFDGFGPQEGEEVVMTFKPKFEDFESVTKAIGDASNVDKLLVQVYADGAESPEFSREYNKGEWNNIKIPFFYGKTYKVYFWAYAKSKDAYEIAEGGLKNGVTVNYPEKTDALGYNALEYLDAFYAVETINLSDDIADNTSPSLTRPFAQVNLMAKKEELLNAKASTVVLNLSAASAFVPGGNAIGKPVSRSFTFTSSDNFQSITESLDGNIYLGTTYIFVSSSLIYGTVTLKDEDGKTLKGPSEIEIPLAINSRTNLVFSGIQPAKLPWNDNKFVVPKDDDNDGWIHITCPEELAALLIKPSGDNINVHICNDIDMGDVDAEILNQIIGKSFLGLKLDGGIYSDNNMEATPTGNNSIKNLSAAAFIGTATNLTVRNLNVDNLQISSATGHVGTIVNTLKGTSSFSNVTVSNSSATTGNGAAGGIVGYIERIAPTTRSEVMEVAFYNCKVNGAADKPVATGSEAEGKFVGLLSGYDNGETLTFDDKCSAGNNTTVADYASRYVEGNESTWQSDNDYTTYDGFLGDEKYLRAKVYFGGEDEAKNRFCPKWDGTTNTTNLDIEPLLANVDYDAGTTAGTDKFVVYSAFDLAGVRKKTASPAAIYLMNHIDMFGQGDDGVAASPKPNRQSVEISDDNLFNPFEKVSYLDGMNFTIHNLFIEQVHNTNLGGTAFIRMASGETTHQNLTLSNPDIKAYSTDPISDGNAYAGTLVCTTSGTYKASNIKVVGGNLFAICKAGGLCGRISSGTSTISNCSVDGLTLRNYDTGYFERFLDTSILGRPVQIDFESDGEIGGLVGFIVGNASITDCSVKNCNFYCTGEDDWTLELFLAAAKVPGRHVNQFIGDIRTTSGQTITIANYTISDNNMHTSETASNKEKYRNDKYKEFKSRSAKTWDCVGFVYAVTIKFNDVPGTVKIDNSTVFVSESLRK